MGKYEQVKDCFSGTDYFCQFWVSFILDLDWNCLAFYIELLSNQTTITYLIWIFVTICLKDSNHLLDNGPQTASEHWFTINSGDDAPWCTNINLLKSVKIEKGLHCTLPFLSNAVRSVNCRISVDIVHRFLNIQTSKSYCNCNHQAANWHSVPCHLCKILGLFQIQLVIVMKNNYYIWKPDHLPLQPRYSILELCSVNAVNWDALQDQALNTSERFMEDRKRGWKNWLLDRLVKPSSPTNSVADCPESMPHWALMDAENWLKWVEFWFIMDLTNSEHILGFHVRHGSAFCPWETLILWTICEVFTAWISRCFATSRSKAYIFSRQTPTSTSRLWSLDFKFLKSLHFSLCGDLAARSWKPLGEGPSAFPDLTWSKHWWGPDVFTTIKKSRRM